MAKDPLFADSFDGYSDYRDKWTFSQGGPGPGLQNQAGFGRRASGQGMLAQTGVRRFLDGLETPHILFEGGFKLFSRFQPTSHPMVAAYYWNGSTLFHHVDVRLSGSLHPFVVTANGSHDPASGPESILQFNVWYYVMIEMLIHASAGLVRVALNHPNNVILEHSGIDTVNHAVGASDTINVLGVSDQFGDTFHCDDLILQDATGGATWYGDMAIIGKRPSGSGSASDFTAVGDAPGHNCVDEISPDGDTTHVAAESPGSRDLYTLPTITEVPSTAAVRFVAQSWRHRKTDSGDRTARGLMVAGANEIAGPERTLATSYATSSEEPQILAPSGAGWGTVSDLNSLGLQIGYEIVS